MSLAAAVAAIVIALLTLRATVAVAPSDLPRLAEVHMSAASVAFAVRAALLAGFVFGVLPLVGNRLDLGMLRDSGRGLTTSTVRMAARRVLVASQMAFAVVLLAAAVLMVRTFQNLRAVRPGFDAHGVLTMDIALPEQRYDGGAADGVGTWWMRVMRGRHGGRERGTEGRRRASRHHRCVSVTSAVCATYSLPGLFDVRHSSS